MQLIHSSVRCCETYKLITNAQFSLRPLAVQLKQTPHFAALFSRQFQALFPDSYYFSTNIWKENDVYHAIMMLYFLHPAITT